LNSANFWNFLHTQPSKNIFTGFITNMMITNINSLTFGTNGTNGTNRRKPKPVYRTIPRKELGYLIGQNKGKQEMAEILGVSSSAIQTQQEQYFWSQLKADCDVYKTLIREQYEQGLKPKQIKLKLPFYSLRVINAVVDEIKKEKEKALNDATKEAAKAIKETMIGDDLVYKLIRELKLDPDVLRFLK